MAAMRRHGARNFNTYPGHHPSMARARDVTPHNWAAANAARRLRSVWYVIYRMRIASKTYDNSWRQYHPISRTGDWTHNNHIHVARYALGGIVKSLLSKAGIGKAPVKLAEGGVVKGGRGGTIAHIGEGRHDELVTPLPKGWKAGAREDIIVPEGGSVAQKVNSELQMVANFGLVG
jgi:hypothetical protein